MTTILDRMHVESARLAESLAADPLRHGVVVSRLTNGAHLIDAGVRAAGSLEAGRLYAECCLGGLGRVGLAPVPLGGTTVLEALVEVDHPLAAWIGSQYAGVRVQVGKLTTMGCGPARSLAAAERLCQKHPLRSRGETAVLLLETSDLPRADVADHVAGRCGVAPERLSLIAASSGSLAGTLQIAA